MFLIAIIASYFFVLAVYVLLSFFIVYHLAKYSLDASLNRLMLPIFVVVSILLLASNIILFFSVEWRGLIYKLAA